MKYFSIRFLAILDGEKIVHGYFGCTSASIGYHPGVIKEIVEDRYRKKYQHAKCIDIYVFDEDTVSREKYFLSIVNATDIVLAEPTLLQIQA